MIPVPQTLKEGTDNYRLFMALRNGVPKSHHELYKLGMIVHSRKSNLVHDHGCLIDTWKEGRTTWYQLRSVGAVPEAGSNWADGNAKASVSVPPLQGLPSAEQPTNGPAVSPLSSSPEAQPVPTKQLEIWSAAA